MQPSTWHLFGVLHQPIFYCKCDSNLQLNTPLGVQNQSIVNSRWNLQLNTHMGSWINQFSSQEETFQLNTIQGSWPWDISNSINKIVDKRISPTLHTAFFCSVQGGNHRLFIHSQLISCVLQGTHRTESGIQVCTTSHFTNHTFYLPF